MLRNRFFLKNSRWSIHLLNGCSLICFFLLLSCSGENGSVGSGEGVTTVTTPSNLVVTTEIVGANTQNPNGDGSGKVNFSVSATNATAYTVNFGNGESKYQTTGDFTVTYSTSGINTYSVDVYAHNFGENIKTTIPITVLKGNSASLLWSDEFNVDGAPNSSKWGYDTGTGSGGWGNNESQYYTSRPENVTISNGILKITAKKEAYLGSNYTSARMLTKGKFSFKYGRVEISAKLPGGGGTWPALWMLGDNISTVSWPACGETDIMEYAGNRVNKITAALHYPGHSGGNPFGGNTTISNAETEFHIYSLDWRETYIKIYVDNQLFLSFANNSSVPFNQNFFLIFNCAMGGSYGGAIDPNFVSSTFEIDYVRVYN